MYGLRRWKEWYQLFTGLALGGEAWKSPILVASEQTKPAMQLLEKLSILFNNVHEINF